MADLYALHWNAVTHANEYTVEVNPGGSGWATLGTTSGTQYTVVNTSTTYQSNIKYRVKAKDTTGVYDDSPYSDELSITYYSITNTLTNCTSDNIQQMVANGFTYNSIITVSDGYIIGSDNWDITIGGTSDKTKGTLSSDGKTLNVAILSANGNIVITASAALEAPAAPTITLTGSTISWAAVTGATAYRIIATADVAKQTDTTSTSFDLSTWSDLTAGTWTIRVLSTNGTVYSDSSNTVTYIVQNKLATPTIAIDGNTLNITDVENAQKYKIYANGELKTTIPKAPTGYKVTFASDFSSIAYDGGELSSVTLTANTGASTPLTSAARGLVWTGVSTLTSSASIAMGISYTDISGVQKTFNQSLTLTSDITITGADDTCLTGDTLITLANGTTKRIDTITLADKVLAYNPETMTLEADEIIRCDSDKIKTHDNFDVWTFSDGTIIKTVHRHRFYNVERNAMVYMDEWKIGEHGRRKDGVLVTLVSHENVKETVNHYTIFTKNQNYFANGLLSGNRYTKPIVFGAKFRERKESDE